MPLTEQARHWVIGQIGRGAHVVRERALSGASTSAVDALNVAAPDGGVRRLVLRRYVDTRVLESEPAAVAREAAVLGALETTDLAVPRVVAVDPDGAEVGAPAILMTRLPGRPRRRLRDLDAFLDRLAAPLPVVHATPVPSSPTFPTYHRYYADRVHEPPAWTRHPDAWVGAIEVHRASFDGATRLIHRDYHPGNVLWRGDELTGIVDWAWACRGPQLVDVAHCRLNLVLSISIEAADGFLRAWQSHAAIRDYDIRWDLVDAVDMLPDLEDTAAAIRRVDDYVARLV